MEQCEAILQEYILFSITDGDVRTISSIDLSSVNKNEWSLIKSGKSPSGFFQFCC